MSDWNITETIYLWLQAQVANFNGIISLSLYDENIPYDKAILFKKPVRTKTNFTR